MFFRSERLFLRPGWPEDWDEFDRLIRDDDAAKSLARAPWSIAAADVRPALQSSWNRLLPCFMVTLPTAQGTPLIGTIGLTARGSDVVVGYWIAQPFRGRGYASEAMRALISLARALGHERLTAIDVDDNPAAQAVLARCGFSETGGANSGAGTVFALGLDGPASGIHAGDDGSGMAAA